MTQIESAKAGWQRADLTWRQLRLDAANERIALLVYERELVRAQAVDRNMVGNDTYDVAPWRGQLSRAQQRWYRASTAARQAHDALDRASANLASVKETYATLMRGGPRPAPPQPETTLADQPPLQLPGWAIARTDIRRRRGLRHFLDDGALPQLRGVAMQLTAKRDAQALSVAQTAAPTPNPASDGKPAASDAKPTTNNAKPAASDAKPAASDAKPAAAVSQGNASAPAPVVVAKPMEPPAPPTSAPAGSSTNARPAAAAPQGNAPAPAPVAVAKPANRPASSTNPPGNPPASPPGVSASGKPSTDAARGDAR